MCVGTVRYKVPNGVQKVWIFSYKSIDVAAISVTTVAVNILGFLMKK